MPCRMDGNIGTEARKGAPFRYFPADTRVDLLVLVEAGADATPLHLTGDSFPVPVRCFTLPTTRGRTELKSRIEQNVVSCKSEISRRQKEFNPRESLCHAETNSRSCGLLNVTSSSNSFKVSRVIRGYVGGTIGGDGIGEVPIGLGCNELGEEEEDAYGDVEESCRFMEEENVRPIGVDNMGGGANVWVEGVWW